MLAFRRLAALALIGVSTLVAYGAQLGYELTDVDVQPLVLTGQVRSWSDVWTVLSEPLMQGRMANALYWRPVLSFSWGLDNLIFGLDPMGYHLTDLLLHLATGLLLIEFVRRLWSQLARPHGDWIALGSALLFVLHPAHVETVPAIARRADLLVGLFLLGTLWFLLVGFRRPGRGPALGALTCCVLGILSKEAGFAIPVVSFLFCLLLQPELGPSSWKRAAQRAGPIVLAGGLLFLLRAVVLRDVGGAEISTQGPLWWRLGGSLWTHGFALVLPGFPEWLAFPSAQRVSSYGGLHPFVFGLAVVLPSSSLTVLARQFWLRTVHSGGGRRLAIFLTGAFGALVLVYAQVQYHPRYLYSAAMFFSVALAWGMSVFIGRARAAGPIGRRLPAGIAAAGLCGVAVSLLALSPLFDRRGMEEWRESATIGQRALDDVDELVTGLPPGTRLYLVHFPYRIEGPALPESFMLLDHSVQGWLELRHPEAGFEVVGLTYASLPRSTERASFAARLDGDRVLRTRVIGGGRDMGFPWSTQHGPDHEGALYEFESPRRGEYLEVRLLDEVTEPEPAFLVWTGERVELHRGWSWQAGGSWLAAL